MSDGRAAPCSAGAPQTLDPVVIAPLATHASPQLRAVVAAILDGCWDFEVEWELDPD